MSAPRPLCHPLDEPRPVVCEVVIDGGRHRALGTWIDTSTGAVVVLKLETATVEAASRRRVFS